MKRIGSMRGEEVPVEPERDARERQRQPQHAPGALEHQQDQRDAEDDIGPRHVVDVDDAVDDVVVVDEDVADRDDARGDQQPIQQRRLTWPCAPCSARCSGSSIASCSSVGDLQAEPEKGQHQREQQMDAAEDVVGRRTAEHLAQRRRDEVHRRDDHVDVVERHRQRDGGR